MTMAAQADPTTEQHLDEAIYADAGTSVDPAASRLTLRAKLIAAGVVLVVLAGAGGSFVYVGFQRGADRLAEANAALAQTLASHGTLVEVANAALQDAEAALGASDARVADNSVRGALAAAISLSTEAIDTATAVTPAPGTDVDEVMTSTTALVATDAALKTSTAALTTATEAVRAAQDAWELVDARASFDTATAALTAAHAAAATAQKGSEGKVDDNGLREDLAVVLEASAADLAAETELTKSEALRSVAETRKTLVASLQAAQQAVTEAQEGWQAAQDKAAAEKSAAARLAQISPSKVKSGKTSTGSTSTAPKSATSTAPKTSTSSQGYYLEETTTTYDDLTFCMDTHGNSWLC